MNEQQRTLVTAIGRIKWNDCHSASLQDHQITAADAAAPPQEPRTTGPARDTRA